MRAEKSFAFENITETPIFELLLFRSIPVWLCLCLSVNGAYINTKSVVADSDAVQQSSQPWKCISTISQMFR